MQGSQTAPVLKCPFSSASKEPNEQSNNTVTYNSYLKVTEITKLQQPLSSEHDEMLFIIIHQTYELWFKLVTCELKESIRRIKADDIFNATHYLKRVEKVLQQLVSQIHILETMRPIDFLRFREQIAPASGLQSTQFREIEALLGLPESNSDTETLNMVFRDLLQRRNPEKLATSLIREIYQTPEKHVDLYHLCESLIEIDQLLVAWRESHLHVVERIIGLKSGTGGSTGVPYLRATLEKKIFDDVWAVRTELT
ncbi:MAG: tryptophan 2,3-dioxygenase [Bacteriovoracia bacterium]